MGFADQYLQKHAIREALISEPCNPNVQLIITIPAFKESGLTKSLDSLYKNISFSKCEVIVLINSSVDSDEETLQLNNDCFKEATKWVAQNPHDFFTFHILHEKQLPSKHFGAGLARKLLMDEAIRRFSSIDKADGIIVSLDADTTVEANYLSAIEIHFLQHPKASGCSINFEHPISGDDFPPEVYQAIINYELYQRYFLECLRYAEYCYAYHTVGSAFAVRAQSYTQQGGMSKRQAGEDFYFIQKLAILGNYSECNTTTVHPSPRPSNRVPFGTGPEIQRQIDHPEEGIKVHSIDAFIELNHFFISLWELYRLGSSHFREILDPVFNQYLDDTNFDKSIEEIKNNAADFPGFLKRCRRKFNQFWILKYLHFTEENGFPKINLLDAVNSYLEKLKEDEEEMDECIAEEKDRIAVRQGREIRETIHFDDPKSALIYFRKLNKKKIDLLSKDMMYQMLATTDIPPSNIKEA